MKEQFKLFIQSIGFVYERQSFDKEYFIMDQYEICIQYSTYKIKQTVHKGVSRVLTTNTISHFKDDLDVFKVIVRDKKLNDLGI